MDYEIRWQIEQLEDGHAIEQATVLFDPDTGETRSMRSKEDSADYRYFPDPDLPPLVIAPEWIERVRAEMTELPRAMARRFVTDYGLSEYDATTLTQSKGIASYFEKTAKASQQPKLAANWVTNEVRRFMTEGARDEEGNPVASEVIRVSVEALATIITRITDGTISNANAKKVFGELWTGTSDDVDSVIERLGLKQMNDSGALEKIVDEVIAANADNVAQFKAGKDKAFNALVGQIMKASKGKANPQQVNELLRKKLA
jgi:aspartyl-tRNA(Asn)/glutamyl-tRNA(Gln) amidotransferase subunit B